ncbi:hypothetical protein [Streptomyces sp. NPDC051561]|uniref:hypothetical protein n=1 Tax=Streptomyces sp. NPDC051561 TaxID=3365658 RepID=UPI0037A31304
MDQHDLDNIGRRIGEAARQFAPAHQPTPEQTATAASVLRDMVDATRIYGLQLSDFDAVADFPRMAIQLVQQRDEGK